MNIENILNRKQIPLDDVRVGEYLSGKTVLITGAAGSVGSELAKRIVNFSPKQVVLLDYAESSLYELEWELKHFFPSLTFESFLANISDLQQLDKVFSKFQPEIIFHTAAYKQVPLLEKYPEQAVLTNISGTKNLTDLALQYKAEKMVFISTDKAVNPMSVMGASKRIAEMYIKSRLSIGEEKIDNQDTQFIITRFGNVLGSNGSVLPLFRKQIEAGGPVTITHPEMTRYFMSIQEAAQLVLEAGNLGAGGETFWFNISKPIKIVELAEKIIAEYKQKVEIVFTGVRPGEKIHEEWIGKENYTMLSQNPYLLAISDEKYVDYEKINSQITELLSLLYQLDTASIIGMINKILPQYSKDFTPAEITK